MPWEKESGYYEGAGERVFEAVGHCIFHGGYTIFMRCVIRSGLHFQSSVDS